MHALQKTIYQKVGTKLGKDSSGQGRRDCAKFLTCATAEIATCLHGECGHCGSGRGNDRPLTIPSSPLPLPPPTPFFHSWRPPALLEIGHKPKVPKTFAANNNNSNNVLNCCHWLNKRHAPLPTPPLRALDTIRTRRSCLFIELACGRQKPRYTVILFAIVCCATCSGGSQKRKPQ